MDTILFLGVLFREIAEEKGITVVELNELAKKDKSIDDMLDERSIRLGKELDQLFLTPAWAGILFRTVLRCSCWQI